jgi:exopolysaccharide biosynthesis WecB/TagA/CpsF family protein
LVWISQLLGSPLPERVAGADLVPLLAEAAADRGWKVHLFGGAPGVADRARSIMQNEHPQATITSDAGPSIDDVSVIDREIAQSISDLDPDVLCVALGNPKQERFIATYRHVLRCPVMIGVGGSLDMLVGDKQRAPGWAQRVGVEWIFRAAQEPNRLGQRYAHDIRVFGPQLISYLRATRKHRSAPSLGVRRIGERILLQIGAPESLQETATALLSDVDITSIEMNFAGIDELDATAHSQLVGLLRDANSSDTPLTMSGVSPTLRQCLEDYRTWPMFARVLNG